ncbi:MAG: PaaI family thioesterase [Desulfomonilaceae bacterium]
MINFKAHDQEIEDRVRSSFNRQQIMKTIGAKMTHVAPGEVHIELTFSETLTQQHGYLHAGTVTIIVDSACGYAAYTLMPPFSEVLTVEYKVNFLHPAMGERFVATGRVIKPGRTLTVCSGDVFAYGSQNVEGKLIATIQATMMTVFK